MPEDKVLHVYQTPKQQEALIEAIKQNLGNVSAAVKQIAQVNGWPDKKAGYLRRQHYRWLKIDPEYAAAYHEATEIALDFAEGQLMKHMRHNVAACIFYLKTKGKHRGYVERDEIAAVVHHTSNVDLSGLSLHEQRLLDGILTKADTGTAAGAEPTSGAASPEG